MPKKTKKPRTIRRSSPFRPPFANVSALREANRLETQASAELPEPAPVPVKEDKVEYAALAAASTIAEEEDTRILKEMIEAAVPAPVPEPEPEPEAPPVIEDMAEPDEEDGKEEEEKPERAREDDGTFKGDDPSTPEVNEAFDPPAPVREWNERMTKAQLLEFLPEDSAITESNKKAEIIKALEDLEG